MPRRSKSSSVDISSIIERLEAMGLSSMAEQLKELEASHELYEKDRLEILDSLISAQEINDTNHTVDRYKKQAKLYFSQADLMDVLYKPERHINAALVNQLSTDQYIERSLNVMIMSATGCGKTFFACAFGNKACEDKYTVRYFTMDDLLDTLHKAEDQGRLTKALKKIGNANLIIIDDFLLTSVSQRDVEYLYRLVNFQPYKNHPRSFIICSQLMKDEMYTRLSTISPSLSDAIMNRLAAKAYQFEIQGDSMRETDIPSELQQQKEGQR